MPSHSKNQSLLRQWAMLTLIPKTGNGLTSNEIHQRLENDGHIVTKRTVERDLYELSAIESIPLVKNESRPARWTWIKSPPTILPKLNFTDAVSLALVEKFLQQSLPQQLITALESRFEEAREQLSRFPQHKLTRWPELVASVPPALSIQPPKLKSGVLETIQQALLDQNQIAVNYHSRAAGKIRDLILHPLGLVQSGPVAYLVALAGDYEDPTLYAIHRIHSVHTLDSKSFRPPNFSLDDYIASGALEFGGGVSIILKARITPKLRSYLIETPLSKDQTIISRRSYHQLTATLHDSWRLQFWILSQGPEITVTKPESLRNRIHELLVSATVNYS